MPFIGFLGPTWEVIGLTRILHRQNVYYHSIYEYSSIFCIFSIISKSRDTYRTNIKTHLSETGAFCKSVIYKEYYNHSSNIATGIMSEQGGPLQIIAFHVVSPEI